MPKKLTTIGALMVLVIGALGVFHANGASAALPVQTFLKADVNWDACFGGAAPTGGVLGCGAGSTDNGDPAVLPGGLVPGTTYDSWSLIRLPQGSRLTLPFTFTPSGPGLFSEDPTKVACGALDANGDCTAGTVTADVTAQVDLLCDAGSSGSAPDVLADAGSTPPPVGSTWPNSYYNSFQFKRVRDASGGGAIPTTSPYYYISQIAPQPHDLGVNTTPNAWTFESIDYSLLTQLYLNGSGAFVLPSPTSLALARYKSPTNYAAGAPAFGATYGAPNLDVSVALLGGDPKSPPKSDYICLDSPQSSVGKATYIKMPTTPGIYPRWTLLTSAADLRNGEVTRVLDMQCLDVGNSLAIHGGTLIDADNDCLPTVSVGGRPADTNDANPDVDGDGVPDGVEVFAGSDPLTADADADGSTDYQELFQFTDPTRADTDFDGSKDKQDTGADEDAPATPASVLDTTADDNCPAFANPTQANSDSAPLYRILPSPEGNFDTTNPHQDTLGDACDPDDDNDGLPDATETVMWIKPAVAPTSQCVAPGTAGGAFSPTDPLNPDTDKDLGLDGIECVMTTNPNDPSSAQRMPAGNAVVDPDTDQLFAPGYGGSIGNDQAELQYRTYGINKPGGGAENNPDGDALTDGRADPDSDNDGLKDGIEVRYYGTNPVNADTDGDGCTDGVEAADVNGDRTVGAADLGGIANTTVVNPSGHTGIFGAYRNSVVNEYTTGPVGAADPRRVNYDFDKNGAIGASDLGGVANALVFKSCAASTGSATSNQQGKTILQVTKLPTDP